MNERSDVRLWVIDAAVGAGALERLADARQLADGAGQRVGALIIGDCPDGARRLIAHGADHVCVVAIPDAGQNTFVAAAAAFFAEMRPLIVFASGDADGSACACRLAVRMRWRLVSPALAVRKHGEGLAVTALDSSGKWARQVPLAPGETTIVTLRPGVAEALNADRARQGTIEVVAFDPIPEQVVERRSLPIDPATADIRHLERLVSGGRGLGGPEGFALLRRIAMRLGAGVAASRVAVDLGWIEYERQVGQTGKTVKPQLYLACGISGASHHLEGMSESAYIVAINSDPQAPIHARAHLGLVADLHQVLDHLDRDLAG